MPQRAHQSTLATHCFGRLSGSAGRPGGLIGGRRGRGGGRGGAAGRLLVAHVRRRLVWERRAQAAQTICPRPPRTANGRLTWPQMSSPERREVEKEVEVEVEAERAARAQNNGRRPEWAETRARAPKSSGPTKRPARLNSGRRVNMETNLNKRAPPLNARAAQT